MSYTTIKIMAEEMARKELNLANKDHPLFTSDHEGYAVILEEFLEAQEEIKRSDQALINIRDGVFTDDPWAAKNGADDLKQYATYLACEAIQLAAMAQKFIDSQKERGIDDPEWEKGD